MGVSTPGALKLPTPPTLPDATDQAVALKRRLAAQRRGMAGGLQGTFLTGAPGSAPTLLGGGGGGP